MICSNATSLEDGDSTHMHKWPLSGAIMFKLCNRTVPRPNQAMLEWYNSITAWLGSIHTTVGVNKSSHLLSVQRDGQSRSVPIPFPFNFRAVAVLVRFQTVPVLSHGQPVRSGEHAQSLIAVISAGRLVTVQSS